MKLPLSWSQLASFRYNKGEWYSRYILNKKQEENAEMRFGKLIGERLATEPSFLPSVPRLSIFEQKLEGNVGNIPLIGFIDSFCPITKNFIEYKTSSNPKKWTEKTAKEHGQLLFYSFMIFQTYRISPKDITIKLVYIPVHQNGAFEMKLSGKEVQVFTVNYSTLEVLNFASYIKQTVKEMEQYENSWY